jgi:hypothetical protein
LLRVRNPDAHYRLAARHTLNLPEQRYLESRVRIPSPTRRDSPDCTHLAKLRAAWRAALAAAGKGALLRREGIYSSLVSAWRQQRDQAALAALAKPAGRPQADPVDRENTKLRKVRRSSVCGPSWTRPGG